MNSPVLLLSSGLPDFNPQKVRSRGVHLSDIVNDIVYGRDRDSLPDQNLLTLGRLFEWATIENYKLKFPDEYLELGEIRYDGIIGHPDLYHIDNIVHEIKYTARSSKGPHVNIGEYAPNPQHPIYGEKYWSNWIQVAGYCIMIGMGFNACREAILELCHSRGDYSDLKVIHNRWKRVFTESELESIWFMLKEHSRNNFCQSCGMLLAKCPNVLNGVNCI